MNKPTKMNMVGIIVLSSTIFIIAMTLACYMLKAVAPMLFDGMKYIYTQYGAGTLTVTLLFAVSVLFCLDKLSSIAIAEQIKKNHKR